MTRGCTICESVHREAVNSMLVAGQSCRAVAAAHGLNYQAVYRHRNTHLPIAIRQAAADALQRVGAAQTAPQATTPAASSHGPASTAPPDVTEASLPVSPVRRRQRALQLTDTPPAPPIEQPATAPSSTTPGVGTFNLYQSATDLRERAMAILTAAERDRDVKTALIAIREARGVLDHMSRLEERQGGNATHAPLDTSPEWHRTRAAIITALAEFPEARIAVAEALVGVGAMT